MKKIKESKVRIGYVLCGFSETDVIPSYFKRDEDDNGSWDWTVDPQTATRFKRKTQALQAFAFHGIKTADAFVLEANLVLGDPVSVADLDRAILEAELEELEDRVVALRLKLAEKSSTNG